MFDPYDPAPLAEPDTFTFPPVEQEIHPYPELPAWARRRLPHGWTKRVNAGESR